MAWQIGVDVGGTFTDLLALDPERGVFRVAKVPSTPEDQSVLYVEKDGDHLPLQIVPGPKAAASTASGGPATGNIDFTDYNKPVTVTVPSGAIDIAQLAALLGAPSGAPSS